MEQHPFPRRQFPSRGRVPQNGTTAPEPWGEAAGEASYAAGYNRPLPARKGQLEEVLDLLHHGKWIILLTFLLVLGGFAFHTYRLVPEYEASALLLVRPRGATSEAESALDFAGTGLFARNDRSLANELVVLRNSLTIASATAGATQNASTRHETSPAPARAGG